MNRRVFIKDEVVYHQLEAGMTTQDLKSDLTDLLAARDQLKQQGLPVVYIIDSSRLPGMVPSDFRKQAVANLEEMDYERIGIFGANSFVSAMANWILRAIGKQQEIKLFSSEEKAIGWVKKATVPAM